MRAFIYNCKIFKRCKYLSIPAILFFVLYFGYIIICITENSNNAVSYVHFLMRFMIIPLGFFMFIGFELSVKSRENSLAECVNILPNARLRNSLAQLSVIGALSVIFAIITLISNIVVWIISSSWYWALILHVLKLCLLYAFLLPLTAGMIGVAMEAIIKKRFLVYLITALWLFSNTSYFENLLLLPQNLLNSELGSTIWYRVQDMFFLTPQGLTFDADYLYGVPMEPSKWFAVIFWLALSIGILLWAALKDKKQKLSAIVPTLICALCIAGFVNGDNCIALDWRPTGDSSTGVNFYDNYTPDTRAPGFTILSYDMELNIGNHLNAVVTMHMTPLKQEEKQYRFTLFHQFKVLNAFNADGIPIPFEQKGDTLYIPASNITNETVTLRYEGYSVHYYSNTQGVFLPGYFPYYPFEGDKIILPHSGIWDTDLPDTDRKFKLKIRSSMDIYSNLSKSGNTFEGTARSVTLMGGMMEVLDKERNIIGSPVASGEAIRNLDETIDNVNTWQSNAAARLKGRVEPQQIDQKNIWLTSNALYRISGEYFVQLDGYSYMGIVDSYAIKASLVKNMLPDRTAPSVLQGRLGGYLLDSEGYLNQIPNLLRKEAIMENLEAIYRGEMTYQNNGYFDTFDSALYELLSNDTDDECLCRIYDLLKNSESEQQDAGFLLKLLQEV